MELDRIKALYLNDTALNSRLVSSEGHLTIALISLNIPDIDRAAVERVYERVEYIVSTLQSQNLDMDIRIIGTMMSEYAFSTATKEELGKRLPYSIVIAAVLMLLLLRNITGCVITLVVTLLSAGIAFGLKGHFNTVITPVTGMAPTTIFTLAIADCVHLLSGFQLFLSQGDSKHKAIMNSLRLNVKAISLTTLTTVIGFLCFNFSSSPAIRDMGNVVAMGVIIAWILTLFLVPILVLKLPYKTPPVREVSSKYFAKLANVINARAGVVAIVFVVVVTGLLMGLPRNELNEVMIEMFDHSYDLRRNTELLNEELTGVSRLYFDLTTRSDRNVSDLEYLEALEAFTTWLREQPRVRGVDSYSDFLIQLNKTMHDDDPAYYRLPESTALAAQYLLLYEASMPSTGGLESLLAIDRGSSRVEVRIDLSDSRTIMALKSSSEAWLRQNAPYYMYSPATSIDILFAETSITNAEGMYIGTLISLVLISVMVSVAVKDSRLGLISLVANLLPILVAYGIWGYLKGRIGISEAMVASLTMGLVVDDTIHFLTKFQDAIKREPGRIVQAIEYAYHHAGNAIIITTVVFVCSFSVFLDSSYLPNVHLSMLTMMTLSLALLFDLFFLPALLVLFYPRKQFIHHVVDRRTAIREIDVGEEGEEDLANSRPMTSRPDGLD